jgi:hypothetical protein
MLAAGCVLIAAALSTPATAGHRERRPARHEHPATQPFAYIRAADAARGRKQREPHPVQQRHSSTQPFAYIRAADERQRQDRHERSHGHHEHRP